MTGPADRLQRWIFLLTAALLFGAAALRAALDVSGDASRAAVFVLLLAWLALLVLAAAFTARWPSLFTLAMTAQTAIVVVLMARVEDGDYYAVLLAVMSMLAMQRLAVKTAFLWIALFAPLTALALTLTYDLAQALVFTVIYAGVEVGLAVFALVTRRAAEGRARNARLAGELAAAGRELEAYARRVERLSATEERHRLARELHDSVTQTVFSMNLTAQSAALVLERDRGAAVALLDQLEGLARHALAEIRALGSELAVEELDQIGLVTALRRHLDERVLPEGLTVTLDVADGGVAGGLSGAEEHALFRIAQEALNNVVKHAQAGEAAIRLRLSPPRGLEIVDDGCGFAVHGADDGGGLGLRGMGERAQAIGWSFDVRSTPGAGTRIVVEQGPAAFPADDGRVER